YNMSYGSTSTTSRVDAPRGGSIAARAWRASARRACTSALRRRICQRYRPRTRSRGGGAGPSTASSPRPSRPGPRPSVDPSARGALDRGAVAPVEPEVHEASEGRISERSPALELAGHEAGVVVTGGRDQARVRRTERLHDHPPRRFAAPGPSGDLDEELERAL